MIRTLVFLVLFFLYVIPGVAQNKVVLDSLELQVQNAETDSLKIQGLLNLSQHYRNNDYIKAVQYAKEATALAHKKNEPVLEQKAERELFYIFFNIGDFKSASVHSFNALKLYEASGDSVGVAAVLVNLGAIHDRLEEFEKALEYYLKAQALLINLKMDKQKKSSYLASLYNNIANIYQTKADFQSAIDYYEKALSLARQENNKGVEGIALNNLGNLYMTGLKQRELAFQYLMQSLEVRKEVGDKNELAKSYIYLSNYYKGEKKFSEAREAANKAISLSQEVGSLFVQRDAFQASMLIEEANGNFKEALQASHMFKILADSIQKQLAGGELAKLKLQYDFGKAEQANALKQTQIRTRFTIVVIVLAASLLISILIVLVVRSRAHEAELKQKNLAQDVEIKNKELTTNILYLVRKNELINDVAEQLLEIKDVLPPENQKAIKHIVLELQRETDNDTWKEFEVRFNLVHSDFYEKLRQRYPDLSPADEKLCAFLRLNMSTKEIAAITKQNVKSLEVARARLRKKLNLTNTSSSLVNHLANL